MQSYRFAQCEVRPADRLLLRDGAPASLGARAFDLLLCLLERHPHMVSKEEALSRVWPGLVVEENNLSVQVSALRKVLGNQAIATVAGRGYRFALELAAPAAVPPAPATHRPTIAVLPFSVRSEDRRVQLLADGLAQDVIALLARVPGFSLISHASSFAFRHQPAPLPEIARQLGVRYLVEGSVRQLDATLRVSTQLTDAASGHVLWSGQFESDTETTGDLQDGIARGIISQLEPELNRAEIVHIRRQRPENLDAWAHYRQAIGAIALQGWSQASLDEARAQLRRSVALDPAFGLGHAHYALLTALARSLGLLADADAEPAEREVLEAAERAIALDEGSAEVLGYTGCALSDIGRHERGGAILQRALEIDPSNAQAHVALGATLAMQGRLEEGIARMRTGMQISPRDRRLGFWGWALGIFLLRAGHNESALAEARTSLLRDPSFYQTRLLEAAALDRLEREDEARQALAAARQLRTALSPAEITLTYGKRIGERLARYWNAAG